MVHLSADVAMTHSTVIISVIRIRLAVFMREDESDDGRNPQSSNALYTAHTAAHHAPGGPGHLGTHGRPHRSQ
jgi:hypothetical protein